MINNKVKVVSTFITAGSQGFEEDAVAFNSEKGIFIVSGGFGGPTAGKKVAEISCEGVKEFLEHEGGDLDATLPFVLRKYYSLSGNIVFNSILHANQKIYSYNKDKNVHEKGGSSLVAAYLEGDLLSLANVGVTTAWLVRNGSIRQLIYPRSYGWLLDPFNKVSDQKTVHSVPLMSLGTTQDLEPEIIEVKIREGDWLVCQSNGEITEFIEKIAEIQKSELSSGKATEDVNQYLKTSQINSKLSILLAIF